MKTKTLYIKIFQPFAQYRNPFTFYYAQTYPLPPKSTIIGMLQNATNRYYDPEFWKLEVSVHGGFESVFWNYQQLIKGYSYLEKVKNKLKIINQNRPLYNDGFKSQRTPVHQQELFNGYLYIFIRGEPKLIRDIKNSLDKPTKILSLGRSEDIAYIRDVAIIEGIIEGEEKTAKKSIQFKYPTYIRSYIEINNSKIEFPIKNKKYPVYTIPVKVIFTNDKDNTPIQNKAEITKKTRRIVDFCRVIYTGFNYTIRLKESVKYEEFTINNQSFRIIDKFGWL